MYTARVLSSANRDRTWFAHRPGDSEGRRCGAWLEPPRSLAAPGWQEHARSARATRPFPMDHQRRSGGVWRCRMMPASLCMVACGSVQGARRDAPPVKVVALSNANFTVKYGQKNSYSGSTRAPPSRRACRGRVGLRSVMPVGTRLRARVEEMVRGLCGPSRGPERAFRAAVDIGARRRSGPSGPAGAPRGVARG